MKTSTVILLGLGAYALFGGGGAQTKAHAAAPTKISAKGKKPKKAKLTAAQKQSVKSKRRAM